MTTEGQRYSIVPSRRGGVHAIYDQVIRRAFGDLAYQVGGLPAVCGHPVWPDNRLTAAVLCPDCAAALQDTDTPRPAPVNPLLRQMRMLYPTGADQ